ncbi:unnamed protein product [Caenorhabditis nigoni]
MSGEYSQRDFKGLQKSTIDTQIDLENKLSSISETVNVIVLVLAFIGILIKVLHLIVLSRKSMISHCVNVIMMGIAICDLVNLSYDIYDNLMYMTMTEWCTGYPRNYSTSIYGPIAWSKKLKDDRLVVRVVNVIDGSLRLIPVVCFPILTFLLILELRKAKKSRENIGSSKQEILKSGQTTKMVIMMTVAFIIAESQIGVIQFLQGVITNRPKIL